MNQKKLDKIIKRDRRRRRAQGLGAIAGTLTSLLTLYMMFGWTIKKDK